MEYKGKQPHKIDVGGLRRTCEVNRRKHDNQGLKVAHEIVGPCLERRCRKLGCALEELRQRRRTRLREHGGSKQVELRLRRRETIGWQLARAIEVRARVQCERSQVRDHLPHVKGEWQVDEDIEAAHANRGPQPRAPWPFFDGSVDKIVDRAIVKPESAEESQTSCVKTVRCGVRS